MMAFFFSRFAVGSVIFVWHLLNVVSHLVWVNDDGIYYVETSCICANSGTHTDLFFEVSMPCHAVCIFFIAYKWLLSLKYIHDDTGRFCFSLISAVIFLFSMSF